MKSITTSLPNNVFINALTRFIMMIMVLDYVLDFVLGFLALVFELAPVLVPVLIVVFVIAFVTHNRELGAVALIALGLLLSVHVVHSHEEPEKDYSI